MAVETLVPNKDEDGQDQTVIQQALDELEQYVNESAPRVPEPIVFSEFTVGERGLGRVHRQHALGVHAGYLMVRRQTPRLVRRNAAGGREYRLG